MQTARETLCRYQYDPLDRLVDRLPSAQANVQRFYLKDRLATEIQGAIKRSIMQHEDQLLSQQQRQGDTVKTTLLATDQQRSVLNVLDVTPPHPFAYTPYGHRSPKGGLFSLLAFNGEQPDPVTGHYLLGNGYRAFNPVLMRFDSPDSWSPFGKGGLNAYAYCVGDPVNRTDPTGHFWRSLRNSLRRTPRRAQAIQNTDVAVQTPIGVTPPQASRAPAAPPLYSEQPTARPYSGMSQSELNEAPPPYTPAPPYTPMEQPPGYFEDARRLAPPADPQLRIDALHVEIQQIQQLVRIQVAESNRLLLRDGIARRNEEIRDLVRTHP